MKYKGVIISGLPCSGKSVLCERLAREYGWKKFSFGGMWRDKFRIYYPNGGDKDFEIWWGNTSVEENRAVNVEGRKLFENGGYVIDSRFSAFYCRDLPYLRAFVTASPEVRLLRAKEREDKNLAEGLIKKVRSLDELEADLKKREKDELEMGLKIFDANYRELKHYQVALDTSELTIQQEFNCMRALIETTR